MADFPYVMVPGKLQEFLDHVQLAGVPAKVTQKYLEQVGFKSKNDRAIRPVLTFIGFVDGSGTPTKRWQEYRNRSKAGKVLASAIKSAYADLFRTYPDAHRKDTEALRNYFSAHTKVGERAIRGIVGTFKALVEKADFSGTVEEAPAPTPAAQPETTVTEEQDVAAKVTSFARESQTGVTINVNIEIGVPETTDPEVYEHFFAALKKHVLS